MKKFMILCLGVSLFALAHAQKAIVVNSSHPSFKIDMPSNPTTGYQWFIYHYNKGLIQPVKQVFHPTLDKKRIGAGGTAEFDFTVSPTGFNIPTTTAITFVYARPWSTTGETHKTYVVRLLK